jgi:hypothetical protein
MATREITNLVCKLKKALYGIKQKAWYARPLKKTTPQKGINRQQSLLQNLW